MNILLNLETIFKIDNKNTDAWKAGQPPTSDWLKNLASHRLQLYLTSFSTVMKYNNQHSSYNKI